MPIDDIAIDDPELSSEQPVYRRVAAINRLLEHALAEANVQLAISRGGISRTVPI